MENNITINEKDLVELIYWLRFYGFKGVLLNTLEQQLGIKLHNVITGVDSRCQVVDTPSLITFLINDGNSDYQNRASITLVPQAYNEFVEYLKKFVREDL